MMTTVDFLENSQIITTLYTQKFRTRMTMNEILINNGLSIACTYSLIRHLKAAAI